MRFRLIAFVPLLAYGAAMAQAAAALPVQESQPLDPRQNQKVEHIHVEDNAVKIDEVRYAGQTQSITVQPKDNLPAYEIQPANVGRGRAGDRRDGLGSEGGERVWKLFNF
jgi:hypothetical protein